MLFVTFFSANLQPENAPITVLVFGLLSPCMHRPLRYGALKYTSLPLPRCRYFSDMRTWPFLFFAGMLSQYASSSVLYEIIAWVWELA